jgi:hypothetical protein
MADERRVDTDNSSLKGFDLAQVLVTDEDGFERAMDDDISPP